MAADDLSLKDALSMFQSGAKDLMFSRALNQANEQVQQIKTSESNEQEKRSQLQQLSNQLVTHMAQLGTPATTMEQITKAIGPMQVKDSNDLYRQSLLSGDKHGMEIAQKAQDFEFNLENKKALAQSKALVGAIGQENKANEKRNQVYATKVLDVDKLTDENTSRFGNLAQLQQVGLSAKEGLLILNDPEFKKLNAQEAARILDRALTRAAPTVEGIKGLLPENLETEYKDLLSKLTSSNQNYDLNEIKGQYIKIFTRLDKFAKTNIKEGHLKALNNKAAALKLISPDAFAKHFPGYIKNKIGENAEVDTVTGQITLKDLTPSKSESAPSQEEIARKMPDGRIAIFDSNKKFLRYK